MHHIEHYSQKGETILDPFCGTGVTGIEALRLRRKVILMDLNPLATFITNQLIKQIDINNLKRSFIKLEENVIDKIKYYNSLSKSEMSLEENPYWYPQKIKLPSNSDFKYVEDLYTKKQLLIYSLIYYYIEKEKDLSCQEMLKFVFSATMSKVNLTYWDNPNRGAEGGGSSIFGAFRYHKPKVTTELDIWKNFIHRFKYILKGKEFWNQITSGFNVEENCKIITGPVQDLTKYVKNNSIDYVYTDPPYGSNIAYLDLSIMWNAWLKQEVDLKIRKEEIIEGGDLKKTQKNYEDLLSESLKNISHVIKKDRWLSLVFAHKKLEFWNIIIDACENNGLEFKGSTFQPTNNSSIHYKKNVANVLCSQRIANFQKTFKYAKKETIDDIKIYILNEIERACLEDNGASIDKIYNNVLDKLHNNNMIHEAKKKGYLKLDKFLNNSDLFYYDPQTGLYYVKDSNKQENVFIKDYFQSKDEFKIYLRSILHNKKEITLNEIHKELFEVFKSDVKFPLHKDLEEVLKEIAYKSKKTNEWTLNPGEQTELSFENVIKNKLVKISNETHTHSEVIYRLLMIGKCLGLSSWIGKKEQSQDNYAGNKFSELSLHPLPIRNIEKALLEKIEQIDLIWFDKIGNPRYAFEVEEHTTINTGIDRFASLLTHDVTLANHLFIVAPKSRKRKLEKIFRLDSLFFGHPLYLETKVGYMYKEELEHYYNEKANKQEYPIENEIIRLAQKLNIN